MIVKLGLWQEHSPAINESWISFLDQFIDDFLHKYSSLCEIQRRASFLFQRPEPYLISATNLASLPAFRAKLPTDQQSQLSHVNRADLTTYRGQVIWFKKAVHFLYDSRQEVSIFEMASKVNGDFLWNWLRNFNFWWDGETGVSRKTKTHRTELRTYKLYLRLASSPESNSGRVILVRGESSHHCLNSAS